MTDPGRHNGRSVRVGLVQMRCDVDPGVNLKAATAHIRAAREQGADIVCLPELFQSRYFCQSEDPRFFDLSESIPGPVTDQLTVLARQQEVSLVASMFERRAPGLYHNTAAILDPVEGYLGKYRKMHIPDDPRYYEKYYFTPGDLGYKTFLTAGARIGVLICWDQWFPEAARLTALQGAEILFYPTAIGWHPEERETHGLAQHDAWEVSQRAHAVANGCFVVSVNRTGFETSPETPGGDEGIQFWGQSFVVAPDGSVIFRAPEETDGVFVVDLDLSLVEEQRHGWPFFRDRRIDSYQDLTQRFIDE